MSIQQRVGDPTGQNVNGVWVSPMRDIAHCFPLLVRRAIEAATDNEMADDEVMQKEFGSFCVKIAQFIKGCVGEDSPDSLDELWKRVDMLQGNELCKAIFEKWFTRVMFGMYFTSIKEAMHPGEKPIGVNKLLELPVFGDEESA